MAWIVDNVVAIPTGEYDVSVAVGMWAATDPDGECELNGYEMVGAVEPYPGGVRIIGATFNSPYNNGVPWEIGLAVSDQLLAYMAYVEKGFHTTGIPTSDYDGQCITKVSERPSPLIATSHTATVDL